MNKETEAEKKARIAKGVTDWIKIKARAEKKTFLEALREIQYMIDQKKEEGKK